MDDVQVLEKSSVDSLFFTLQNKDGITIVCRIVRMSGRKIQIWMLLEIPGIGFFQHPQHPDSMVYNVDEKSFSGGGLTFIKLQPLRRWRIVYNGNLRKGHLNEWSTGNKDNEYIHVKISFIWESYTDIFDDLGESDPELLAESFARDGFSEQNYVCFEQWGESLGIIEIENHDVIESRLRGIRRRIYGKYPPENFCRSVSHICRLEGGITFQIGVQSTAKSTHLSFGHLFVPLGWKKTISWTDLHIAHIGEDGIPPNNYSFKFIAGGTKYAVTIKLHEPITVHNGENWETVTHIFPGDVSVNGEKGRCVVEFCCRSCDVKCDIVRPKTYPLLKDVSFSQEQMQLLTVQLSHVSCRNAANAALSGGKGCQLAHLINISSDLKVSVPSGICVTTSGFKKHLEQHKCLATAIKNLKQVMYQQVGGNLQDMCNTTLEMIESLKPCPSIQNAVASELKKCFGSNFEDKLFAVRSSAAAEDGSESSSAGQMKTILGVKGLDKIYSSITECWASHFSFQAVEYRRQNGQPANSGMAVVIQEMVPSDSSGVLFTCDPLTFNRNKMVINANFGLGESVVSGEAEPDMVTLLRSSNDSLEIVSKEIGSKDTMIVMKSSGDTDTEVTNIDKKKQCCISDEVIIRLGKLGIELEKYYGDCRDVEWAIKNGEIYLLQARPITSVDKESDFEMNHEFDSPLSTDFEWITTANIQEANPGPATPFTANLVGWGVEAVFEHMTQFYQIQAIPNSRVWKFVTISNNHMFLNLFTMFANSANHMAMSSRHAIEFPLMGRILNELSDEVLNKYLGFSNSYVRLRAMYRGHKIRSTGIRKTKELENFIQTYQISGNNAKDVYKQICDSVPMFEKGMHDSIINSAQSSVGTGLLLAVLSGGTFDYTVEMAADIANILAGCENVLSADVPQALKELAGSIVDSGNSHDFLDMDPESAVAWLKSPQSGIVHKQFASFIERHGHRCIKEMEIRVKAWKNEPTSLIPNLKALIKSGCTCRDVSKTRTIDEIVDEIKTPLTWKGRWIIRKIIPWARQAVSSREWGKSIMVKVCDRIKDGLHLFGDLMVNEGRIPDADLVYFLTILELGQLLETRSSSLISKAIRRRKIHASQLNMRFPQISEGHPIPIKSDVDINYSSTGVSLRGTPVSQGIVKGKARVIKFVSEAESIEHGEILICPFTDIGWTPYFPLISGLATEIGGIMSHGAVIAREYGLPCILNCKQATDIFKSGDTVILNGAKGTLEKVEEEK